MAAKGGPTNLEKEQVCSRAFLPFLGFWFAALSLLLRWVMGAFHWTDVWDGGEGDGVQG
jgi:hypothetical protein